MIDDQSNPEQAEELLSRELFDLSLENRNDFQDEIHGVRCIAPQETPELLRSSLDKMAYYFDCDCDSEHNAHSFPLDQKRAHPPANKNLCQLQNHQLHPPRSISDDVFAVRIVWCPQGWDPDGPIIFLELLLTDPVGRLHQNGTLRIPQGKVTALIGPWSRRHGNRPADLVTLSRQGMVADSSQCPAQDFLVCGTWPETMWTRSARESSCWYGSTGTKNSPGTSPGDRTDQRIAHLLAGHALLSDPEGRGGHVGGTIPVEAAASRRRGDRVAVYPARLWYS